MAGTKHGPSGKIRTAKACEACRRRRIKCDGEEPCSSCTLHRTACNYRAYIRGRRSKARTHEVGHASRDVPSPSSRNQGASQGTISSASTPHGTGQRAAEVPDDAIPGMTASQRHNTSGSIEVFCGASSTFALIHDLYLRLRRCGVLNQPPRFNAHEENGLDAFRQQNLYFGNTTNLPTEVQHMPSDNAWRLLDPAVAREFCGMFFSSWHQIAPVTRQETIESSIFELFQGDAPQNGNFSPDQAITLVVVALGALASGELAWAEVLYLAAKKPSYVLDETTSTQSVTAALLLALFQASLGRSTTSYVYLGAAARKAFAMGFDRHSRGSLEFGESEFSSRTRRTLIWTIYVHDCWISMSFGKKRALSASDVLCTPPEDHQLLSQMIKICRRLEECERSIYTQKHSSLRAMWQSAQSILEDVQNTAKELELAYFARDDADDSLRTTVLHALYYHTITLVLRPFAMGSERSGNSGDRDGNTRSTDKMWLREARRQALAAAEDQIVFLSHRIPHIKQIRFLGFFIESSSILLLHDTFRDPTHYPSNVQSIRKALDCLSQLVQGEPVTSATASIQQTLTVVERAIGSGGEHNDPSAVPDASTGDLAFPNITMDLQNLHNLQPDAAPALDLQSLFLTDGVGSWDQWLFDSYDTI